MVQSILNIHITILSSSPAEAGALPDARLDLEPLAGAAAGAGAGPSLGLHEEDRSRRSPRRNPMARPGRKFEGRRLAASHGSSPCERNRDWRVTKVRRLWERDDAVDGATFLLPGFCGGFRRGGGAMDGPAVDSVGRNERVGAV